MGALCRDCLSQAEKPPRDTRCVHCGSPRLVIHDELAELAIAHIDCDAFYASVEKRDKPELGDKPVIVGGRHRGVVMAACYVARVYGVRSAMPMFKALRACPDAVVISPDMAKYQAVGRQVRECMRQATPLVEPLSVDEAFLDLSGTEALHGGPPARTLARLALDIERQFTITASIGLSYNKFLAKIASNLDKPRGFAVIGRQEVMSFLERRPVGLIWGVGKALNKALARDGITKIGELRSHEEAELVARYGAIGRRLYRFSRGEDPRPVEPDSPTKSISSETTFNEDLKRAEDLSARLWPLCEKVASRLKRASMAGRTVTLKLKTAEFRILTRSATLADPTQLAEVLFQAANPLLERAADGRRFRLIGVGVSDLGDEELADPPQLLDPGRERRAEVERAIDAVRAKLGDDSIRKGRALGHKPKPSPKRA